MSHTVLSGSKLLFPSVYRTIVHTGTVLLCHVSYEEHSNLILFLNVLTKLFIQLRYDANHTVDAKTSFNKAYKKYTRDAARK
jgi:hypothetical protein